ncbi:hypothetical protein RF11_11721 [Thelohanellus kitauei]|uniref:Uncharacterized protein n=1 Tax=Thelohanellus kitauei TaxID=669202 RepID=A0A0C2J4N0_THEKT|nr:hypothetical protein RF11_11721 [Thelohanellus kitauei]
MDCKVIMVDDLSLQPPGTATRNFRIQKDDKVQKIELSISSMIMIKASKDFHIVFKIHPVLPMGSHYKLETIMTNEAEYVVMISLPYCIKEWLIMLFTALGCIALILGCGILVYYKIILPRVIVPRTYLRYIIDPIEMPPTF